MSPNYSSHESNVKLVVGGIVVLIFFFCVFGLLMLNLRTQQSISGLKQDIIETRKSTLASTPSPIQISPVTSPAQEGYTYYVENAWQGNQKLIRINDRTGQKEDMAPLAGNVFSHEDGSFSVNIVSRIDNSYLVLKLALEIDAPLPKDNFWLYNMETKQIKKMNSEIGPYGIFSPDGRYYVYPVLDKDYYTDDLSGKESRELMALDILADSTKSILTLPQTETLLAQYDEFRYSPSFGLHFIDKNTVEYSVYVPGAGPDTSRVFTQNRLLHL